MTLSAARHFERDTLLGVLASVGRGQDLYDEAVVRLAMEGWVQAFDDGSLRPDSPEFLLASLFGWSERGWKREAWKELPRAVLRAGAPALAFTPFTGKPEWAVGQSCEPGSNLDRFLGTTPIGYAMALDSLRRQDDGGPSGLVADMVRRGGADLLPWLRQAVPGQDAAWLGHAVQKDDERLLAAVLNAGISPNETERGRHVLSLAESPGMVQRLLAAGARVARGSREAEQVLVGSRASGRRADVRATLADALGLAGDPRVSQGLDILRRLLDGEAPGVRQVRNLERLHVPGLDAALSGPALVALGAILGGQVVAKGGERRAFWNKATTALQAMSVAGDDAVGQVLVGAAYALLREGEPALDAAVDRAAPLVLRAAMGLGLQLTDMGYCMAAWLAGRPADSRIDALGRWTWLAFEAAFNPCDIARDGLAPTPSRLLDFRAPAGQRAFGVLVERLWKPQPGSVNLDAPGDTPVVELGMLAASIAQCGRQPYPLPYFVAFTNEPSSREDGETLMRGFGRLRAYAGRYVPNNLTTLFLEHLDKRSTETAAWLAQRQLTAEPARTSVRRRG